MNLGVHTDPGCNGSGAPIDIDDEGVMSLATVGLLSTAVGCFDVRSEMDSWTADVIVTGTRLLIDGQRLHVVSPDGTTIDLAEQPSSTAPTESPPGDPVPDPPETEFGPMAQDTGVRGDTIAAELLPGYMIGDRRGLAVVVHQVRGALAIPPAGVYARRWDGRAWAPVDTEPFGVNAYAGIGVDPYQAHVNPADPTAAFLPGWYEARVVLVEARSLDEPRPTMTLGTPVLVPNSDTDLRTLAGVLPTRATAIDGDRAIELVIEGNTLRINNTGAAVLRLPSIDVERYDDRGWIPSAAVPTGVDQLAAQQTTTVPLSSVLADADAIRLTAVAGDRLHVALEYVGLPSRA